MNGYLHSTPIAGTGPLDLADFMGTVLPPSAIGFFRCAKRDPIRDRLTTKWLRYPTQMPLFYAWVEGNRASSDLYFCPDIYSRMDGHAQHISHTACARADLDGCNPSKLRIPPSLHWETSPGRYQAVWVLEPATTPPDAERISQAIARAHRGDGCDQSGADLSQLLRIPGTINHKYPSKPQVGWPQ